MTLKRIMLRPYALPLRMPWRSSQGSMACRRGWLVCLKTADGNVAYGDCPPMPEAGTETATQAWVSLQHLQRHTRGLPIVTALEALGHVTPAARYAFETALLALCPRHPPALNAIPVNAMLGNLMQTDAQQVAQAVAEGFSILKLKVGLRSVRQELGKLHLLVDSLPAGVRLRLDANRAWPFPLARQFLREVADLPIESVEEPLQQAGADEWLALQALVPFPLALDESLPHWRHGIAAHPAQRLVLKPAVLGGFVPTLRLAQRAMAAGKECVVTTVVESAVGVRATAHLAAVLGNGLTHGLATSVWLAKDVTEAPRIVGGMLQLNHDAG
ncbi:MAG: o-succinylbenzoate synthase [Gammaproteobacteria bacterium]|nr:o-succinylbenzoate synthase [Gammaproteobacteria bacterium]MBU1723965.1 o-succinylbenzoate synthase [Gammaproteobacteria bacterium]MBU2007158.1 o-succinylbenzoate synthase [Gammaproteobacteria bacterium]